MRHLRLGLIAVLIVCGLPALLSATSGSFRGIVVRGPDVNPGWIWVKGAKGSLRKVGINGAHVVYDSAVPRGDREQRAELSIKAGAEIRVTADQDGDGEWRASKVEILRIKADEPTVEPSQRTFENMRTS